MTYKLRYKLPRQLFRRTLKNVTYNYVDNGVWIIIFSNGSAMCLPLSATIWAGPDRHMKYKQDAEKTAGQPIVTDPGGNAK